MITYVIETADVANTVGKKSWNYLRRYKMDLYTSDIKRKIIYHSSLDNEETSERLEIFISDKSKDWKCVKVWKYRHKENGVKQVWSGNREGRESKGD